MSTIYDKLRSMLNSGKPLDVKFIHVGSGTELFKYCKDNKFSYIGFGTENFLQECIQLLGYYNFLVLTISIFHERGLKR